MSLPVLYKMKKRMAKGGRVDFTKKEGQVDKLHQGANEARMYARQSEKEKGVHRPRYPYPHHKESFGESDAGYSARDKHRPEMIAQAKGEHKKVLEEMKSMPKPKLPMAEGGDVHACPSCGYSEGGMVANDDLPEADSMPNEFDDLHLRDDLEMSETGENSGDEEGPSDVVSRIMSMRKKKAGR